MADTPPPSRRRVIGLGEFVALSGLIISGLALWNSWGRGDDKPAPVVVEKERAVPLVLRGKVEDEGKAIRLTAAEDSHALEDVTITAQAPGAGSAPFGNEPMLSAAMVEGWLPKDTKRAGVGTLPLTISTRYIEHGKSQLTRGAYRISYGWKEGGLLGGRSLRLTGFTRG